MRRNQGLGNLKDESSLKLVALVTLRRLTINLKNLFVTKDVVGVHRSQHEVHVSTFQLCQHLQW